MQDKEKSESSTGIELMTAQEQGWSPEEKERGREGGGAKA